MWNNYLSGSLFITLYLSDDLDMILNYNSMSTCYPNFKRTASTTERCANLVANVKFSIALIQCRRTYILPHNTALIYQGASCISTGCGKINYQKSINYSLCVAASVTGLAFCDDVYFTLHFLMDVRNDIKWNVFQVLCLSQLRYELSKLYIYIVDVRTCMYIYHCRGEWFRILMC